MQWDIFCTVIDNYGDIGVCWRLSQNLAAQGQQVRLWVDDASALRWMAPAGQAQYPVDVIPWPEADPFGQGEACSPGDVVVEAFGCEPPADVVQRMGQRSPAPIWINLEYLTAEAYAGRCHGLPSPVMSGPGKGLTKHFFYPGFFPNTGGLLRESALLAQQARFNRQAWLASQGLPSTNQPGDRWVSLFCYEPAALPALLSQLNVTSRDGTTTGCTHLLVAAGRATAAVQAAIAGYFGLGAFTNKQSSLSISYLPMLSQLDFDHLLWACDLNFVRGEDSLVRALWAGKPLVWQIYPQSDTAHHAKLLAFLDMLGASALVRQWHHSWNGLDSQPLPSVSALYADTSIAQARERLLQQDDLGTQLMRFARRFVTDQTAG